MSRNGFLTSSPFFNNALLLAGTTYNFGNNRLIVGPRKTEYLLATLHCHIEVELAKDHLITFINHTALGVATTIFPTGADADNADVRIMPFSVRRPVWQIMLDDPVWDGRVPRADQCAQRLPID